MRYPAYIYDHGLDAFGKELGVLQIEDSGVFAVVDGRETSFSWKQIHIVDAFGDEVRFEDLDFKTVICARLHASDMGQACDAAKEVVELSERFISRLGK